MLNIAILGSSSLVSVPDLTNLTPSEALSLLSSLELLVGSTSTTTSGANASNDGKIASQSVVAGTSVERYTSVNYVTYYYYVAPPPPPNPPPAQTVYFVFCNGNSVTSGASSGGDCATLYAQYGYPTGWSCGSSEQSQPTCGAGGGPAGGACSDGCIDDDAGYCVGFDYYTYRYHPTQNCQCTGALVESNSVACGGTGPGNPPAPPPSPPPGGTPPTGGSCTPSCSSCDGQPAYSSYTCVYADCSTWTGSCD